MLKFAANLTMFFTDVPFLQRFEKARAAGFDYIEFQFPYAYPLDLIKQELHTQCLGVVLFNLPAGDWDRGERGIAILPDRRQEFRETVDEAIRYAHVLTCSRLHCMAGVLPADLPMADAVAIYKENIHYAASKLATEQITLFIEPINRVDMPGYFLSDPNQAYQFLQTWKLPNVKLQFDFYHVQRIQGELLSSFSRLKELIGHVQIADNPGRHQPGTGEINYSGIFRYLKEIDYKGFIGLEYFPKGDFKESLQWLRDLN